MKKDIVSGLVAVIIVMLFLVILMQYYGQVIGISKASQKYNYMEVNSEELLAEMDSLLINFKPKNELGEAKSITVLNYHRINPPGIADTEYSINYNDFKEHMLVLKKAGYETIDVADLEAFIDGSRQLPEKSLVITFDDGIKDSYYMADSLFKELGYKAVIFIITKHSVEQDRAYYLNRKELVKMHKSGRWDIQSHSHDSHDREKVSADGAMGSSLTNLIWLENENRLETPEEYEARIRNDLGTSKSLLEELLGKKITGFALPFGDFGQRTTNYQGSEKILIQVAKENYKLMFYQFKPTSNRDYRSNFRTGQTGFNLIMRISSDDISAEKLLEFLEASNSLDLPYMELYENKYNWINIWGSREISGKSLVIGGSSQGGALSYLDGSYLWKDYYFQASVNVKGAENVFLVTRFQDAHNYVACKYGENNVYIRKVVNGEKTIIADVGTSDFNKVKPGSKLKMIVQGNKVSCYIDGQLIVEKEDQQIPPNGGIGVIGERFDSIGSTIRLSGIEALPL